MDIPIWRDELLSQPEAWGVASPEDVVPRRIHTLYKTRGGRNEAIREDKPELGRGANSRLGSCEGCVRNWKPHFVVQKISVSLLALRASPHGCGRA